MYIHLQKLQAKFIAVTIIIRPIADDIDPCLKTVAAELGLVLLDGAEAAGVGVTLSVEVAGEEVETEPSVDAAVSEVVVLLDEDGELLDEVVELLDGAVVLDVVPVDTVVTGALVVTLCC